MMIDAVAQKLGLPVSTIRYYAEQGSNAGSGVPQVMQPWTCRTLLSGGNGGVRSVILDIRLVAKLSRAFSFRPALPI